MNNFESYKEYTSILKKEFATDFEIFMADVVKDIENRLPTNVEIENKNIVIEEILLGCLSFSLAKICAPFSMEMTTKLLDNFLDQTLTFLPALHRVYDELNDEED